MKHTGYTTCLDNPDLWMKPMSRMDCGFEYWDYIMCYVDDILCINDDLVNAIDWLGKYFKLNPGSVIEPNISGCET